MRSNVLKITDFHKLIISTPIDSMAARVTRSGAHDPPPKDNQPMISPDDLLLFYKLFGDKRFYNRDQRRPRGSDHAASGMRDMGKRGGQ